MQNDLSLLNSLVTLYCCYTGPHTVESFNIQLLEMLIWKIYWKYKSYKLLGSSPQKIFAQICISRPSTRMQNDLLLSNLLVTLYCCYAGAHIVETFNILECLKISSWNADVETLQWLYVWYKLHSKYSTKIIFMIVYIYNINCIIGVKIINKIYLFSLRFTLA